MSLRVSLGLALAGRKRLIIGAPQYVDDSFDVLLTQSGDAIITQSGLFIVRQRIQEDVYGSNLITQSGDSIITQNNLFIVLDSEQYELVTQDGVTVITQDGRTLQVGF